MGSTIEHCYKPFYPDGRLHILYLAGPMWSVIHECSPYTEVYLTPQPATTTFLDASARWTEALSSYKRQHDVTYEFVFSNYFLHVKPNTETAIQSLLLTYWTRIMFNIKLTSWVNVSSLSTLWQTNGLNGNAKLNFGRQRDNSHIIAVLEHFFDEHHLKKQAIQCILSNTLYSDCFCYISDE